MSVDPVRIGSRDYVPVVGYDSAGVALTPLEDGGSVVVEPASACSITSVADAASDTVLLAANTARKFARIVNDSTAVLYVACGEAASATNYTAALTYGQGFDVEGYTGAINGLWASDAGGNARISEFT